MINILFILLVAVIILTVVFNRFIPAEKISKIHFDSPQSYESIKECLNDIVLEINTIHGKGYTIKPCKLNDVGSENGTILLEILYNGKTILKTSLETTKKYNSINVTSPTILDTINSNRAYEIVDKLKHLGMSKNRDNNFEPWDV